MYIYIYIYIYRVKKREAGREGKTREEQTLSPSHEPLFFVCLYVCMYVCMYACIYIYI